MISNRDKIKEIVMEILVENEQSPPLTSGRNLFWHALKGICSTWIYMRGTNPLASVWYADGQWYYSIPILDKTGLSLLSLEDAMKRAETHLDESDTNDGEKSVGRL